jgi:hypothetical protein
VPARTCAYCGADRELTREHLWPTALHARLMAANNAPCNAFWLRRVAAEIEGEPTIRDVCRSCNNGTLSELDSCVCTLFDRYFVHILKRHEVIWFQYDYHLLARWLLKMSFNSARIHSSIDRIAYPPLLDYVCGRSTSDSRSVQVFIQLSYPGLIPPERMAAQEFHECPALWEPQDNRVGLFHFEVSGIGRKILRAIHLRSYSFFIAFFKSGEKRSVVKEFAENFISGMLASVLLAPSRPEVDLVCNGADAWLSCDGARKNQFVVGHED